MSDERTVLVTGGASGIGLAVAEAALAEGWRVVVADLNSANLDRAREALRTSGARARFVSLDVGDEEAIVQLVGECEDAFGPLTGVVNSAGIGRDVPSLETTASLFRTMLEVNLIGSFLVSREAARGMCRRGRGSIVNIASVSGIMGNKGRVAYGASKGGVIAMTKVMAVELAPLGVRVNAIAPGPVETPLVQEVHTAEVREAWLTTVPQHRYGTPAEIAASVVFLLDDSKSGFVTGQTLCVDGGFSVAGIMSRGAHPPAAPPA